MSSSFVDIDNVDDADADDSDDESDDEHDDDDDDDVVDEIDLTSSSASPSAAAGAFTIVAKSRTRSSVRRVKMSGTKPNWLPKLLTIFEWLMPPGHTISPRAVNRQGVMHIKSLRTSEYAKLSPVQRTRLDNINVLGSWDFKQWSTSENIARREWVMRTFKNTYPSYADVGEQALEHRMLNNWTAADQFHKKRSPAQISSIHPDQSTAAGVHMELRSKARHGRRKKVRANIDVDDNTDNHHHDHVT